jgi:hypothetical protein
MDPDRIYEKLDRIEDLLIESIKVGAVNKSKISFLKHQLYAMWTMIIGALVWIAKSFFENPKT